eukprot:Nk52_evm44s1524 gene=Nk52_evmTU44s1524
MALTDGGENLSGSSSTRPPAAAPPTRIQVQRALQGLTSFSSFPVSRNHLLPASSSSPSCRHPTRRSCKRGLIGSEGDEQQKRRCEGDDEEVTGERNNRRAVETRCDPWDIYLYFNRVESFTLVSCSWNQTWGVNPFICARYGWRLEGGDSSTKKSPMMECVSCRAKVVYGLSKTAGTGGNSGSEIGSRVGGEMRVDSDGVVDEGDCDASLTYASELKKRVCGLLSESHKDLCPWKGNPSPLVFEEIPHVPSVLEIRAFLKRGGAAVVGRRAERARDNVEEQRLKGFLKLGTEGRTRLDVENAEHVGRHRVFTDFAIRVYCLYEKLGAGSLPRLAREYDVENVECWGKRIAVGAGEATKESYRGDDGVGGSMIRELVELIEKFWKIEYCGTEGEEGEDDVQSGWKRKCLETAVVLTLFGWTNISEYEVDYAMAKKLSAFGTVLTLENEAVDASTMNYEDIVEKCKRVANRINLEKDKQILFCRVCRRKCGLWNFAKSSPVERPNEGVSPAASDIDASLLTQDFNPEEEHRWFCTIASSMDDVHYSPSGTSGILHRSQEEGGMFPGWLRYLLCLLFVDVGGITANIMEEDMGCDPSGMRRGGDLVNNKRTTHSPGLYISLNSETSEQQQQRTSMGAGSANDLGKKDNTGSVSNSGNVQVEPSAILRYVRSLLNKSTSSST